MRVCTKCKVAKSQKDFPISGGRIRARCKKCESIHRKRYYENNAVSIKQKAKTRYAQNINGIKESQTALRFKKLYNISLEDRKILFEVQQGRCKICSTHESELTKKLVVDHAHDTGAIRGLLCHKCNSGLGFFKDDIKLIGLAMAYLETKE